MVPLEKTGENILEKRKWEQEMKEVRAQHLRRSAATELEAENSGGTVPGCALGPQQRGKHTGEAGASGGEARKSAHMTSSGVPSG